MDEEQAAARAESQRDDDREPGGESRRERLNIFYRLTLVPVAALIVTVLAFFAMLLGGDPRAPVNRFLSNYGGLLLALETGCSLLFGLLALAVDRRRIVEERQQG